MSLVVQTKYTDSLSNICLIFRISELLLFRINGRALYFKVIGSSGGGGGAHKHITTPISIQSLGIDYNHVKTLRK